MDFKHLEKFIKDTFMDNENEKEVLSDKSEKEISDEVAEAKLDADIATEDLVDDENEEGLEAEDVDDNVDDGLDSEEEGSNLEEIGIKFQGEDEEEIDNEEEIHHSEIMKMCEDHINSCEEHEDKELFCNTKKFYDGATSDEAKAAIALKMNNKVFKLNT
jgi:hypothetical protein